MTPKEQAFADHYLASHNATQAAIAAGYSEIRARRTGYDKLRKPDIAAYIRKAEADQRERLGIDADWVVQQAVEIVEQARRGVVRTNRGDIVVDDAGEPIMDPQLSAAVSSLNVLAKVLGLGAPQRVEHEHTGEVVYRLEVGNPPALEADVVDI